MTDDLKVGLKVTADTAEANAELKNTEQSVKGLGTGGKEATAGLNDAGAAARKTAADTEKLDSSAGGATRELKQTGAAAQTTSAEVNKLGTSGDKAAAGLKHVGTSAEESGKKSEHSVGVYQELRRGLVELAAASIGIEAAKGLTELADEAQNAAAKIRLTTSSEEEFADIQKKLLDLSQETRTSYVDNVQFYQRLYNATKNLTDEQGKQLFNTTDLIQVQTTLNQALQLSGATSTEATNGLIQLSQGLASGVLRGQDLRAVLDDIPGVANALADGLGVSIGKLRELAEQGVLTPTEVVNALLREGVAVNEQFKTLPETVGGAITNLRSQLVNYVGEINSSSGASQDLVGIIEALAKHIDVLGNVAQVAGAVAIGKLAKETVGYASSALSARAATKAQTAATLELATSQQATTATTLEAAQATKTAALAKMQAAEAAALLAKTDAEVAAAATAVAAAEIELAVAQKAEAIAQTQATVAAKEYQTVVKSGIVSTKLLANGVGGLVSGLVNLAIAYEAGNAVGSLLYDNFEFIRKGANNLVEGMLLLHAELFGTADDVKKIEANFASAVTSTEKFGDAAEKAGAKSAGGALKAKTALDDLLGTLSKTTAGVQAEAVTLDDLGSHLNKLSTQDFAKFTASAQTAFGTANGTLKALTNQINEVSDKDAPAFMASVQKAFNTASTDVEQLGKVLETVRTVDLKKLGLDADLVRTGIDAAMTGAIVAVKSLGSISTTTAVEMQAAFSAALSKATTKEDAQALIKAIEGLNLPAETAAAEIAKIKAKLDELPAAAAALDPVNQALKRLGVEGVQQLNLLAKHATEDFATIEKAGTQSAGVVADAFGKMADAQLKVAAASGTTQLQIAAAGLKNKASTQGESDALDKLIAKYPELAGAATKSGDAQAKALEKPKAVLDGLLKDLQEAPDLDAIRQARDAITQAFNAGKIAADEYTAALGEVDQKTKKLTESSGGAASALANIIQGARSQFVDMGQAATDAFDRMEKSTAIYGESVMLFMHAFADGVNALVRKSQEEVKQANMLTAALSGVAGQTRLNIKLAQDATSSFHFLDSQTLSNLNAAITAAKQNLDSLRASADQTLNDLENQLDQLNGNTLAVEQRANDAKRATIEAQLQSARQAGDRQTIGELQRSLDLLNKIGQVQQQQAQKQQAQKQQQQAAATPTAPPQSSGRYDLNLTINGHSLGTVQASSQSQAEQIIAALQAAQRTSTIQ